MFLLEGNYAAIILAKLQTNSLISEHDFFWYHCLVDPALFLILQSLHLRPCLSGELEDSNFLLHAQRICAKVSNRRKGEITDMRTLDTSVASYGILAMLQV